MVSAAVGTLETWGYQTAQCWVVSKKRARFALYSAVRGQIQDYLCPGPLCFQIFSYRNTSISFCSVSSYCRVQTPTNLGPGWETEFIWFSSFPNLCSQEGGCALTSSPPPPLLLLQGCHAIVLMGKPTTRQTGSEKSTFPFGSKGTFTLAINFTPIEVKC
jgi:hypothetical protein